METMDATFIEYSMELTEQLDAITTYKAVFAEYRKYKTPKKGVAPTSSAALLSALQDLRHLHLTVPPIAVFAECELQSAVYLKNSQMDNFIGRLAAMKSNCEFITDLSLPYLTIPDTYLLAYLLAHLLTCLRKCNTQLHRSASWVLSLCHCGQRAAPSKVVRTWTKLNQKLQHRSTSLSRLISPTIPHKTR